MSRRYDRIAAWLLPRKRGAHIAVVLLTLLMIPGCDDGPPAHRHGVLRDGVARTHGSNHRQRRVSQFGDHPRFPRLGPQPRPRSAVEDWTPVPRMADGSPDYASLPHPSEMVPAGEPWEGIDAPTGGILNLTVLQELDTKLNLVLEHPLAPALKPLVNDVTGHQSNGAISLSDHFRGFMNNTSILTQPGLTTLGVVTEPPTNWTDCFPLDCLEFDDANITQAHIDMAAARMAEASDNNFLRWLSLDRGFKADYTAFQEGPVFGRLLSNGTWENADWQKGRWTGSSTWLLVQLDSTKLQEMGWEVVWKDAHQEKQIQFTDEGFRVGGYRLADGHLVLHPPQYTEEECLELQAEGAGCATEWTYMDLEGHLRTHDQHTVTLLLGQGVNVEVNRELQSSAGLIAMMGLAIVVLLYVSLRRWSDVAIVMFALGAALLWMQGLIGHFANITGWLGLSLIARSQFSNLLPILVLALGIDDSLHALHRYKEERANGKSSAEAGSITVSRVGRAITLTSLTTMSAFAANLFSDIAALRSFGIEAALGVLAAFILTGLWAPLDPGQRGRLVGGSQNQHRTGRSEIHRKPRLAQASHPRFRAAKNRGVHRTVGRAADRSRCHGHGAARR